MHVHFPYEVPRNERAAFEAAGIKVTCEPRIGRLCHEKIWQGAHLSVWYPEKPRTPGHLVIGFGAHSFTQVTPEAYSEMHGVIQKIYAAQPKRAFVVSGQERQGEYLVEVLPERPPVEGQEYGIKNVADKVSCHGYVIDPENPYRDISYHYRPGEKEEDRSYWTTTLQNAPQEMPPVADTTGPWTLRSSHTEATTLMIEDRLNQILTARGGTTTGFREADWNAVDRPSPIVEQPMGSCAFCRPEVLAAQTIIGRDGFRILYNLAGGDRFLLISDHHTPRLAEVTNITAMYHLQQDFCKMLATQFPGKHVVTYCQDAPSVGQTVRHMHLQITVTDPDAPPEELYIEGLRYLREGPRKISPEEMAKITAHYRKKFEEMMGAQEPK